MNSLLMLTINMTAACPLLLASRETNHDFTGNVCKLRRKSYSHDSFIQFMCENKAFLDMIENHADHDKHAGFQCNTDHVKVEHSDRMKNKHFTYKHCEKNTDAVKKIAKFNNHDTDKFCHDYTQQFDYSKMGMQQIVNLCKPYYIRSDKLNAEKQRVNQDCCHQRLQDHMPSTPYSIECHGGHSLTETVDDDILKKHMFIITYANKKQIRFAVKMNNINVCSVHIR